jgi:hypothetical protein
VTPIPRHQFRSRIGITRLEQDVQHGNERHERKNIQYGREYIEHYRQHQIFLIGRYESPQYLQKFLHLYRIVLSKKKQSTPADNL